MIFIGVLCCSLFPLMLIGFQRITFVCNDFHWCSLMFVDVHRFSLMFVRVSIFTSSIFSFHLRFQPSRSKINENQGNQWKSTKINENQRTSMEDVWNSKPASLIFIDVHWCSLIFGRFTIFTLSIFNFRSMFGRFSLAFQFSSLRFSIFGRYSDDFRPIFNFHPFDFQFSIDVRSMFARFSIFTPSMFNFRPFDFQFSHSTFNLHFRFSTFTVEHRWTSMKIVETNINEHQVKINETRSPQAWIS